MAMTLVMSAMMLVTVLIGSVLAILCSMEHSARLNVNIKYSLTCVIDIFEAKHFSSHPIQHFQHGARASL